MDLFRKVDAHYAMLRELIEHSVHRNATRQKPTPNAVKTVQPYRMTRGVVSSIHITVIQESFWRCPCRNIHTIRFVLNQKMNACDEVAEIWFRMVLPASASGSSITTMSKLA